LAARNLLLLTAWISCSQLVAQPEPAKPIESLRDLELGMPRDHVLAGLSGHYKIKEEFPSPPDDPSKGFDAWVVFSGDAYAGELLFNDGKLKAAAISLYTTGEGGERELVDKLFETFFDNSGRSTIKEEPRGSMTRNRSAVISLESMEQSGADNFKVKTLKFLMLPQAGDSITGRRLFILSVTTQMDGSRTVNLNESIIKEWQGKIGK
jgi:hypothetical protein